MSKEPFVIDIPERCNLAPRRWAEHYYNLKRWAVMPAGGHFASMEEPDLLVKEIRTFFRALRE
jgi:pimeloyl-ACP methyl ester carboxylesterase